VQTSLYNPLKPAISLINEIFKKRQLLSPIGPNHPNFEEPVKQEILISEVV